jgi:preprotein translocase subunit SecY
MSVPGAIKGRDAFVGRLAVTAALLFLYRLGCHIPLPGLEPTALPALFSSTGLAGERISIFAFGIWPLISIMILVEIAKTLFPGLRRWELEDARNARRLAGIVVALALVLAAVQGLGYAGALEQVTRLVEAPGASFRVACAATLVAGLALLIGMARAIDANGLGSGVWLLFLAPTLAELPARIVGLYGLYAEGSLSPLNMALCLVFTVLAMAALVSLILADPTREAVGAACVWSLLMASVVAPWLLMVGGLIVTGADLETTAALMSPGTAIHFGLLALLIGVAVNLYARSVRRAGRPLPWAAAPIAGVLILIALAPELLWSLLGLPLVPLKGVQLVVATVVAARILLDWNVIGRRSARGPANEQAA